MSGFTEMRNLSERLIAEESRVDNTSNGAPPAAFRVCEKLRRPLSTLAGSAGFRSLLGRALVLARADVPWLRGIQVRPDGTLQYPPPLEAQLDTAEAAEGGAALVKQLINLLVTFIGEPLTLRLVLDVWPNAALKDPELKGKQL
jgi:hypothetical protein